MVKRATSYVADPKPANEDSDENCEVVVNNTVPAVFVGLLGVIMIALIGGLAYIMRYYKREINKYKQVTPIESSHVQDVPKQYDDL